MIERWRFQIQGIVQGVGFRPFIYRLALEYGLCGWVNNSAQGVTIEAEASSKQLAAFKVQLLHQKPPHSDIQRLAIEKIEPCGEPDFKIAPSDPSGHPAAQIVPDLATCPDCLRELFDPNNRRYRYPFINCTHCGPRYSIIENLPYDRPNTTMRRFRMCPTCQTEYEDPLDRRFHAQPNACPHCGPRLALWDATGGVLAVGDTALINAAILIANGKIVALKGIGGFQLLVDARNANAVQRLRERKHRPHKPFAVMFPGLEAVRKSCLVSDTEAGLLRSPEAPIVLLERRKDDVTLCLDIAPQNAACGAMLPYSPLHHLLLAELGFPIVATSGNRSGEPICIDEFEALEDLAGIADYFLVHDRPIGRAVDDSVGRVMAGTPCLLRRARGYAPLAIPLAGELPDLLATGAELKNTIALSSGRQVIVSQHIGDLENIKTIDSFQKTISDLIRCYDHHPTAVICDLHPDYQATHAAEQLAAGYGVPLIPIQHHYAHAVAVMAEHRLTGATLGVIWDGTGYGTDGTIWGGEFLRINERVPGFERVAWLHPFRLVGGDQAAREPRRVALGLCYETFGDIPAALLAEFDPHELTIMRRMLAQGINSPYTSSMGRLFDGVAALLGLCQRSTFEGQAAIALEAACTGKNTTRCYPFSVTSITSEAGTFRSIIEWKALISAILDERDFWRPQRRDGDTSDGLCATVVGLGARGARLRVYRCCGNAPGACPVHPLLRWLPHVARSQQDRFAHRCRLARHD
jgi:hydrogenase maturation protein HypF